MYEKSDQILQFSHQWNILHGYSYDHQGNFEQFHQMQNDLEEYMNKISNLILKDENKKIRKCFRMKKQGNS